MTLKLLGSNIIKDAEEEDSHKKPTETATDMNQHGFRGQILGGK